MLGRRHRHSFKLFSTHENTQNERLWTGKSENNCLFVYNSTSALATLPGLVDERGENLWVMGGGRDAERVSA